MMANTEEKEHEGIETGSSFHVNSNLSTQNVKTENVDISPLQHETPVRKLCSICYNIIHTDGSCNEQYGVKHLRRNILDNNKCECSCGCLN